MHRFLVFSLFVTAAAFADSEAIDRADSMDQLWPEKVERGNFFFQH